jgi:hypothetical protein
MNKISICDRIICDGVIDMLRSCPVWNWHAYRAFPFFRRSSAQVRDLFCFSVLSLNGAREIAKWYEYHLNETEYPWISFKRFIIAISNQGIRDAGIMNILEGLARYLEKKKTNKLLEAYKWFVPYNL